MTELLHRLLPTADEGTLKKFELYYRLLIEWNSRMNLTAITAPEEVATKHFLDSLAALPYLPKGARVIDVGTGAGFPGVPLALVRPDIKLTLTDALQKRISFLDELCERLELPAARIHARAEELGRDEKHRGQYDIALSRAVAPLPVLLELTIPFVKVGGTSIAYKGEAEAELQSARAAMHLLHVTPTVVPVAASYGARCLLLCRKDEKTPAAYPRKAGTPSKQPL